MTKIATATFQGASGKYSFEVYPADTNFNPVGAVYVFSKRVVAANGRGTHDLLYIGQTDSLANRIPNHEKWEPVSSYGANCVCVHRDDDEQSRFKKETDLLIGNNAPCNDE